MAQVTQVRAPITEHVSFVLGRLLYMESGVHSTFDETTF